MRHARNWRRYIRFWGPNVDADIDDELRFHLEARIAEYERLGYSPEEAARLTRERVGELTDVRARLRRHDKQQLTIYRSREHMKSIAQDFRYGFRKLRQAPGFSLAVIAVLALGIGANTAIYSAVDAAFFRPLPFPAAQQLVVVNNIDVPYRLGMPSPKSSVVLADVQQLPMFRAAAAYAVGAYNLSAASAEPRRVDVAHVTTDFFRVIGRYPQLGRVFSNEEETAGGPHAAILSHRIWQQSFGSDPRVIGRTLQLNDRPYTIVGVMPSDVVFPSGADLYAPLPLPITFDLYEAFKMYIPLTFIGRVAPDATVLQAGAAVRSLEKSYPNWKYITDSAATSIVTPLQQDLVPQDRHRPLLVFMGAAILVLLIACANVINLLLARATTRMRELAIRSVLGASRGRILLQLTIESLTLAIIGALAGVGLGLVGIRPLRSLLPAQLVAVSPPTLDMRLLAFTLAVAIGVGLIVGLWPALQATRGNAAQTIKAGGAHGATERGGHRVHSALVVAEISLALVLVIGAGLMIESFRALVNTDTGLRAEQTYTAHVTLPRARYQLLPSQLSFYSTMLRALRASPGVTAAGLVNRLPLSKQGGVGLKVSSPESPTTADSAMSAAGGSQFPQYLMVTSGYFASMGIPILRGRDILDSDGKDSQVLVVNRTMANEYWPGMEPLGKHVTFGNTLMTVVGVVGDVRTSNRALAPAPQMYLPLFASSNGDANIVVRGTVPHSALAARIHDAVRLADPTQFAYDGQPMSTVISNSIAPERTNTLLLGTFGALALALAAIGVYAVLAYGVSRRFREFGVRVALGAERRDVLRLVMREGFMLVAAGVAIGIIAAIALSKLIASLLYQVSPHDVRIFVLAPIALMAIALAATLIPALRATRVDPMEALRAE